MKPENEILIGWASEDITPYGRKVNLYGQFGMRVTNKVKDPVTATALSVSQERSNENALIFVSCDICTIPVPLFNKIEKVILGKAKDFPIDRLVVNSTHTHTGPDYKDGTYDYSSISEDDRKDIMMPKEYETFLAEKVADAAIRSWESRKKGMFAWGFGQAVVGHNRRAVYLKDFQERPDYSESPGQKVEKNGRMYGNTNDPFISHIEGFEDHSAQFLFTFDENKKLTGAIINIACPSQETEGISEISADFWHETRELLREQYGKELFVLPQCSAAGDQPPHLLLNKKAEERMRNLKGIDSRMEIALRIKTAFDETLKWASKDMKDDAVVKHVLNEVSLPKRIISKEEYDENLKWRDKLQHPAFRDRCEEIVRRYESQKEEPAIPEDIHAVRLGDIVFVSNPFELFLDYGVRIQAQSPAVQTFLVQLAGSRRGIERGGTYLPTERAEQGGGYSACLYCNLIGHDGGQVLVEESLKSINKLFKEK